MADGIGKEAHGHTCVIVFWDLLAQNFNKGAENETYIKNLIMKPHMIFDAWDCESANLCSRAFSPLYFLFFVTCSAVSLSPIDVEGS